MNKTELVDWVAEKAEISKVTATKAIEAMIGGVTESLRKDRPVVFTGFGTWTVQERAARAGRNPATGEPIQIGATKVISFKAGKALKDAVKDAAKEQETVEA